jgi:hypothetical protein
MKSRRRFRRSSHSEETLEWLERVSDQNILLHFFDILDQMPASKRRDLINKGYLVGSNYGGNLSLTEKGQALLTEMIEPSI